MVTGQFIADLISWGAIGARTTESQIHREMASALSCPVGFKNGTDGNTRIAVDAIRAARASHMFLSPDKNGQMTIYQTSGNPYGHIIMRGGKKPNYPADDIAAACDTLHEFDLPEHFEVACQEQAFELAMLAVLVQALLLQHLSFSYQIDPSNITEDLSFTLLILILL